MSFSFNACKSCGSHIPSSANDLKQKRPRRKQVVIIFFISDSLWTNVSIRVEKLIVLLGECFSEHWVLIVDNCYITGCKYSMLNKIIAYKSATQQYCHEKL